MGDWGWDSDPGVAGPSVDGGPIPVGTYDPGMQVPGAVLAPGEVPTTATTNLIIEQFLADEKRARDSGVKMAITPERYWEMRRQGLHEQSINRAYYVSAPGAGVAGAVGGSPARLPTIIDPSTGQPYEAVGPSKVGVATPISNSAGGLNIAPSQVVDQNGNPLGDAKTLIESLYAEIERLKRPYSGNNNRMVGGWNSPHRLLLAGYDPVTIAAANQFRQSNALRGLFGYGLQMPDAGSEVWEYMQRTGMVPTDDPGFMSKVANALGVPETSVKSAITKLGAAGASGLLMGLTGNFPVAAMGYFALDRMLDPSAGKQMFKGALMNDQSLNGIALEKVGIDIPPALPHDIFADYRYICYDRLTNKWWPSDEVKVLSYSSNTFRWLCLDRLDGKMYQANVIMRPRIYLD